ncbi:MAG: 4Fe-4S binding protein [Armatimonadota bacterium]
MLTSEKVKQAAKQMGADLVGIASMDRFEGAPEQMDPRHLFPEAQALIGLAFRIPRGYLRGIEEGTHFYQYPSMGYANINEVYAPMVLHELACLLEDHGYEGAVFRNTGGRMTVSDMTGAPDEPADYGRRIRYSRPVAEDRPAPDVMFHFRIAAFCCGLGEIGYSKLLLTPQFGPRQRFAFMLTDAPLQPDPLYDGPALCDRCMACVTECPVDAISAEEAVTITLAGREVTWGKLAEWQCFHGYMGSVRETNPFLPPDAYDEIDGVDPEAIMAGRAQLTPEQTLRVQRVLRRYYGASAGYNSALCGGRGCLRACMVHLEETGVLSKQFRTPFRRRKPWRL